MSRTTSHASAPAPRRLDGRAADRPVPHRTAIGRSRIVRRAIAKRTVGHAVAALAVVMTLSSCIPFYCPP